MILSIWQVHSSSIMSVLHNNPGSFLLLVKNLLEYQDLWKLLFPLKAVNTVAQILPNSSNFYKSPTWNHHSFIAMHFNVQQQSNAKKRHLFSEKNTEKTHRWGRKSGLEALLGGFETQASKTLRDQRGSFQPILLGEPWRKQRIQALDFLHQTAFRHVFANGHVKKNEKVWTISLKIQGIVQSFANFLSFTSILPLTLFWSEGWVSR